MDQSGSMAESVVYGSVTGSIFASLPALNMRVVAFDTEVVDITEQCGTDPVDMIFGVPCFGCTPNKLPELIEGVLKKQDLKSLAARVAAKKPNA